MLIASHLLHSHLLLIAAAVSAQRKRFPDGALNQASCPPPGRLVPQRRRRPSLIKPPGCSSELTAVHGKLRVQIRTSRGRRRNVSCQGFFFCSFFCFSSNVIDSRVCPGPRFLITSAVVSTKRKNVFEATSCDQTPKHIRTERSCPLLLLFFFPCCDRNLWSEKFSCRCRSSD